MIEPRRVLVCGSRTWTDRARVRNRLACLLPFLPDAEEPTIVHGDARGADKIAAEIALDLGLWVEAHPADWKAEPRKAGILRNLEMLDTKPDLVIAFQRGESRGTQDTIDEARKRGIHVEVHRA